MSELVQGRLREGKKDVQKPYDMVWRNGLWVKMWELGVRGEMWKEMYRVSRSAVLLDGECSEAFDMQQALSISVSSYKLVAVGGVFTASLKKLSKSCIYSVGGNTRLH